MKKRNEQIDVARGIAILLVILGHSFYSIEDPLNKIILSFHMPLFFFLSGIVAKIRDKETGGGRFILGKLKTILLPQVLLGMVSYIYYGLFTVVMKGGSLKEVDFLYQFWRYWFLQVLFLVVIIFYFISQKIHITSAKCQIIVGGICVILGLLFEYIIKWPDESPFYINVVPMAFFFYLLGFACRGFFTAQLKQICDSNGKEVMMLIIALCSLIVCALCNSSVTMYNNNYGLFPIFILGSLSGIVVVWVIADFMQKNMFLKWCGKNSIVIYVWQFVLTQFFKNVIEIIFNVTHVNSPDFIMTVCVFGVCVFAVIPIVIFSNRFVPELYGKKRVG